MNSKKNIRGMIAVGITLAVAGIGYLGYRKYRLGTPAGLAKAIYDKGYYSSNPKLIEPLALGFLQAWYEAAKAKQDTFTIDGDVFTTQGGKKVK